MLTTYYGFWDYWELRHKVTFDGVNKLIWVNPGVTSLDVQIDLYSDWKEWVIQEDNAKYEQAFDVVGGEPTVEGEFLDATYFLLNGWRIKPYQGVYTLNIVGNLFEVDGGDIKVPADIDPLNPNNITVNLNTYVIVRRVETGGTTGGGLTTEQDTALFNIEGRVLNIESILQGTITARLEEAQAAQITDLQNKLKDLWELHGLNTAKPVTVSPTSRSVGDITQTITESGETVTVTRE